MWFSFSHCQAEQLIPVLLKSGEKNHGNCFHKKIWNLNIRFVWEDKLYPKVQKNSFLQIYPQRKNYDHLKAFSPLLCYSGNIPFVENF